MPQHPLRHAFTLMELLVVIGIIAILFGLLLPAIMVGHASLQMTECENHLRQIVCAAVQFHDENPNQALPPGAGFYPQGTSASETPGVGNAFFHLLPYLDWQSVWKNSTGVPSPPGDPNGLPGTTLPAGNPDSWAGTRYAGFNGVFTSPIALFRCPCDPTDPAQGYLTDPVIGLQAGSTSLDSLGQSGYFGQPWGTCSYAMNGLVFLMTDTSRSDGGPGNWNPGNGPVAPAIGAPAGDTAPDNYNLGWMYTLSPWAFTAGAANLVKSFPDGTSNTILFTEKYAQCNNATFSPTSGLSGGNYWAYATSGSTDVGDVWSQSFGVNSNNPSNPGSLPHQNPVYPMIAVTYWDAANGAGNMTSIGPASVPQIQPTLGSCDPLRASSPHRVCLAAMADGSVHGHAVKNTQYDLTWWMALTPDGGDVLGADW
jgi:prepilin-type N-terminal cleavage/methylation domain-containing protein